MKKACFGNFVVCLVIVSVCISTAYADRGGWKEPPGGWEFIEEWHEVPPVDFDPATTRWNHNNGSDQYSGNANTDVFKENGWEGGEVVRIDTIGGAGDTEDGSTPADDASVLTLIDLGDPRDWTGGDPSDRKLMFAAMANREEGLEKPFVNGGVTFLVRYRMLPLDMSTPFQSDNDWADPPFNFAERPWIPEQYDRVQVGIGYFDEVWPDHEISIGIGYYAENSLFIQGNDTEDPDGDENILISDQVDTTAFNSVWVTAIAEEYDPNTAEDEEMSITVRAWVNGSAEPLCEGIVQRGPDVADRPDPHDLGDFPGFPQAIVEFGMCATNNYGAMQIDYICARFDEAVEPEPGTPVNVSNWSLF